MAKREIATEYIEKFRIKPSVKKKLEVLAEREGLKLNDFIRAKLQQLTNKK